MDDVTLKSVLFGGFRKKDVIAYIEQLKLAEMEQAQAAAEQIQENEQAAQRIQELELRLEESRRSNEELAKANAAYAQEVLELERANIQMQAKVQEMEKSAEKLHAVESQIGGMMLEAQIYSDKLMDDAKEKVSALSENYCQSAQEVSADLVSFTRELSSASSAFSDSFSSYVKKILVLSKHLESTVSTIQYEAGQVSATPRAPAAQPTESTPISEKPAQPLHVFPPLSTGEERPQITDSAEQKPFSVDFSRIENTALYQNQVSLSRDFYAEPSASQMTGSLSARGGSFTLNS